MAAPRPAYTVSTADALGLPPTDPAKVPPNPANDRAKLLLLETARRNVPGQWTDNRYEQAAHLTDIVYGAVRAKALLMSGAKVSVQERRDPGEGAEGDDEDWVPVGPHHPLARAIADPNARHTTADLLEFWVQQLDLTGTALTAVFPDRSGGVAELWPLPTAECQAVPMSAQYPFGGWRVNGWGYSQWGGFGGYGAGMTAVLDANDVIAHRYKHPRYMWDGYSPLTAGGRILDVLEAIQESRKATMDQGTRLDGIVAVKGMVGDDQAKAIRDKFARAHGGSQNHGGVAVVEADALDFNPLNTSPKDIDFASGWQQMIDAALMLFGVPPIVAGLKQNGSYAELYAALKQFIQLTMEPLAASMGRFLTKFLCRRFYPDDDLRVVVELPESGDKSEKLQEIAAQSGNVHTHNEARAKLDLDPVDGGDVPYPVYEAALMAKAQAAGGGDGGADGGEGDGENATAAGGGDPSGGAFAGVGAAILESLGVRGKAVPQFDESKVKRAGGKFAPKGGGDAGATPPGQPKGPPPLSPGHAAKATAAAKRVAVRAGALAADVLAAAGKYGVTPETLIGSAQDWCYYFATEHADPLAQALGMDTPTAVGFLTHVAGAVMAELKPHLSKAKVPAKDAADPPAPPAGDTPTGGAPPAPDNPAAAGTLPPRPGLRKAIAAMRAEVVAGLGRPIHKGVKDASGHEHADDGKFTGSGKGGGGKKKGGGKGGGKGSPAAAANGSADAPANWYQRYHELKTRNDRGGEGGKLDDDEQAELASLGERLRAEASDLARLIGPERSPPPPPPPTATGGAGNDKAPAPTPEPERVAPVAADPAQKPPPPATPAHVPLPVAKRRAVVIARRVAQRPALAKRVVADPEGWARGAADRYAAAYAARSGKPAGAFGRTLFEAFRSAAQTLADHVGASGGGLMDAFADAVSAPFIPLAAAIEWADSWTFLDGRPAGKSLSADDAEWDWLFADDIGDRV